MPDPFFFFFQEAQEVVEKAMATSRAARVIVRKFIVLKKSLYKVSMNPASPDFKHFKFPYENTAFSRLRYPHALKDYQVPFTHRYEDFCHRRSRVHRKHLR